MVQNTFDQGAEEWRSYDYEASVREGREVFLPVTWERAGGVNDSGYVWTDDSRWTIDAPETPNSILALIFYTSWAGEGKLDLREAEVSVYLRGDGLDLKGARCHFWALKPRSRWHFSSLPIDVPQGEWGAEPVNFTLDKDEAKWHRSWSGLPPKPVSLNDTISVAVSYSISFIGFSEKVTGRLCMDEFRISLASDPI